MIERFVSFSKNTINAILVKFLRTGFLSWSVRNFESSQVGKMKAEVLYTLAGGVCILLMVLYAYEVSLNDIVCGSPLEESMKQEENNIYGHATTGNTFTGNKVNSFKQKDIRFSHYTPRPGRESYLRHGNVGCDKWSVVTTIFDITDAVKKQSTLRDWCIVVVGDMKGPHEYVFPNTDYNNTRVFLSNIKQDELQDYFSIIKLLPWNSFGRKNIGYLYAMLYGAKYIWDFDDDNELNGASMPEVPNISSNTSTYEVSYIKDDYKFITFNPYGVMGAPTSPSWPRGLPLEHIKLNNNGNPSLAVKAIPSKSIGVIQSLANNDPDVDAVYRLTQPLPFSFPSYDAKHGAKLHSLLIPSQTYVPYNAQATLNMYNALWSLYLPVTVNGRVSDIWRSYIQQRLARDIGISLVFSPPLVSQYRNSHSYIADLDSENHLYLRSLRLLEQLNEWKPVSTTLPGRLEEVYIMLYEKDYIKIQDVHLIQAWISDLIKINYIWPQCI